MWWNDWYDVRNMFITIGIVEGNCYRYLVVGRSLPETAGTSVSVALLSVEMLMSVTLIPRTLVLVGMSEGAALESVGMSMGVTLILRVLVPVGKSVSVALVSFRTLDARHLDAVNLDTRWKVGERRLGVFQDDDYRRLDITNLGACWNVDERHFDSASLGARQEIGECRLGVLQDVDERREV